MQNRQIRLIVYGQLCFIIGIVLCVIVRPEGLSINQGLSYFGTHYNSLLPYILALFGPAYYLIRLGESIHSKEYSVLRYGFIAIGVLAIGILLTPDNYSKIVNNLHIVFGATMFSFQLLLSAWMCYKLWLNWSLISLTLIELGWGILCFIYLAPSSGLLMQMQILFQLTFGLVALYSVNMIGEKLDYVIAKK